jgi:hypothetical protein
VSASPELPGLLGLRVVAGRSLNPSDHSDGAVLVNETLARRLWPGESAVGRRIACDEHEREVVGVVSDAITNLQALARDAADPAVYAMISGGSARPPVAFLRNGGESALALAALSARIDPNVRTQLRPLRYFRDRRLSYAQVGAGVAAMLGALAVALAALGVFGVFAYIVAQRTREIGIRMALGATGLDVVLSLLRHSARSLAFGLVGGFAATIVSSRLLAVHLYGVGPFDPLTFIAVAVVLTVAALVATYVPARRVTRIDPIVALRCE